MHDDAVSSGMIVAKRMSSSGYRHIDHTKDNDTHCYGPMPDTNKNSCEGPTMDPVSANLLLGLQHLRRPIRQTRIANTSIISTAVQHGLLSHVSPHVPHAPLKRYREKNKEN